MKLAKITTDVSAPSKKFDKKNFSKHNTLKFTNNNDILDSLSPFPSDKDIASQSKNFSYNEDDFFQMERHGNMSSDQTFAESSKLISKEIKSPS